MAPMKLSSRFNALKMRSSLPSPGEGDSEMSTISLTLLPKVSAVALSEVITEDASPPRKAWLADAHDFPSASCRDDGAESASLHEVPADKHGTPTCWEGKAPIGTTKTDAMVTTSSREVIMLTRSMYVSQKNIGLGKLREEVGRMFFSTHFTKLHAPSRLAPAYTNAEAVSIVPSWWYRRRSHMFSRRRVRLHNVVGLAWQFGDQQGREHMKCLSRACDNPVHIALDRKQRDHTPSLGCRVIQATTE